MQGRPHWRFSVLQVMTGACAVGGLVGLAIRNPELRSLVLFLGPSLIVLYLAVRFHWMSRGTLAFLAVLLAVLIALLLPAVQAAREAARRSQCVGNLKWVVVGMLNYHDASGSFPPAAIPNPALPPERRIGWPAEAYTWLSGYGANLKVDGAKGWNDPANWPPKLVAAPGVTFAGGMTPADTFNWTSCPDHPAALQKRRPLPLTYVGIAGLGSDAATLPARHPRAGVFGYDRVTRIGDILDGPAQTLMFVETARDIGPWMAGGSTSVRGVDPGTRPYLGRDRPFGGYHNGGANAAFCDGSVRFVRESIDPNAFEALATIAGGETITEGWDRR